MYDQTRAQQPADHPRGPSEHRGPTVEPLFTAEGREEIVRRVGRALNTFPDTPRESLKEAEAAFDETTAQLMSALAAQRRALRAGWEDLDETDGPSAPEGDGTEASAAASAAELHLVLRRYREITQRLLRL
ncbi:hypothetical protein ACFWNK_00725 [Streptomyces sp. NPDC058417]|uniref:hypothetical protein n=1 Tax=unclassified Streptomyces TaxID=2593676 RepID=UPI00365598B5